MITRGEFDDLISNHSNAAKERNKARSRARYELRRPLLKQIKAQAARIAELEADRDHWRNMVNDLEHNSIYLDSIAFYEGRHAEVTARIAELEAALRGLYEHTKNNQQICGLNERARAVLDKEA